MTFGLLEHLCLSVLPAWRESSLLLVPSSRAAALAVTLAGYAVVGALLGGAAGAGARLLGWGGGDAPSGRRAAADAATATLVLAWTVHLAAARSFSRSAYLGLAVSALLVAALVARTGWPHGRVPRVTAWLVSPAGASVCLLAPLVFRDRLHLAALGEHLGTSAGVFKAGAAAAGTSLLVLLLVAGALFHRGTGRHTGRARLAVLLALALTLGASSVLLDRAALSRLSAGGAAPAPRESTAPPRPTGILLLTLDAVRADHLPVYGYPLDTSPNLASLARHATVYLNARAASDMSLGTHASLFTGKYPSRHGAWVGGAFPVGRPLAASERTLAERAAEAGCIRFAAVANGYFLNTAYGLSRGFQLFDVPRADRLELRLRLDFAARRLAGRGGAVHTRASEVNAVLAKGFDAARAANRPFFAFANYMEAHDPYTPDRRFLGRFPGYDPSLPRRAGRFIGAAGSRRVIDGRERRHLVSLYDSAIATLDRELGLLFDRMRTMGLYDGALIVVTADHGEMLGERGVFGHGAGLVDEVLRIPLIVKFPFQREARRVAIPVSQVDVVPTLLDLLGLPPDPGLDGISLLEAEQAGERELLAESPPERAVFRAGSTVLERVPAGQGPGPLDPEALERLKSLGYVR
ncbi:MAG TPA: sulfatase [Vicinamibacterales bacterium]|nr:sulfatase [Vicinamibacterales bacterium]